jgi:hypothetical protein
MKFLVIIATLVVSVVRADDRGTVTVPLTPLAAFLIAAPENDMRNDGSVVVGSWVGEDKAHPGDRPADALNVSRIECYPSMRMCVESSAAVQRNEYLTANTALWEITEATKTKITATVAGLCVTSTLTINATTKEVTNVSQDGGIGDWALCIKKQKWPNGEEHPMYTPIGHPIVWKMVSGLDAMKIDDRFKRGDEAPGKE